MLRNTSRNQGSGNRFADTVCQICGRFGHTALRCWNRFDYSYQSQDLPQALAAMSLSDSQDPNWYTDTDASAHMTADAGNLKNITPNFGKERKERKLLARKASSEGTASSLSILATSSSCSLFRHSWNHVS